MLFEEEAWLDGEAGVSLETSLFQDEVQNTRVTVTGGKISRKRKKRTCKQELSLTSTGTALPASVIVEHDGRRPDKERKVEKRNEESEEVGAKSKLNAEFKANLWDKKNWRKNRLKTMMSYRQNVEKNSVLGFKDAETCIETDTCEKSAKSIKSVECRSTELRNAVTTKLQSAKFRFLNEQLYSQDSQGAKRLFAREPESFVAYHSGFFQQVSKWPINPLDLIISFLKKRPPHWIIADFGCGDARLAASVKNKVHSFDLVAVNERVTVADMCDVPLADESLDVAVFCLSLMGTNYVDFLKEANRTLRHKGLLLVAEVASRFQSVPKFLVLMKNLGFELKRQDRRNTHFLLFDFMKLKAPHVDFEMPTGLLKPCVYKKR